MQVHVQTDLERAAWAGEFSDKVRDGIVQGAENPQQLMMDIKSVQDL
jgi:hypothetical protein